MRYVVGAGTNRAVNTVWSAPGKREQARGHEAARFYGDKFEPSERKDVAADEAMTFAARTAHFDLSGDHKDDRVLPERIAVLERFGRLQLEDNARARI